MRLRLVVRFIAGFVLLIAGGLAAAALTERALGRPRAGEHAAAPLAPPAPRVPPAPRLEADSRAPLRALRAREDAVLGSYGWADRSAGLVRIPIERAMDLVAERGLPVAPPGALSAEPAVRVPTDSSLGLSPDGGRP